LTQSEFDELQPSEVSNFAQTRSSDARTLSIGAQI
jgi:hypothetical protein